MIWTFFLTIRNIFRFITWLTKTVVVFNTVVQYALTYEHYSSFHGVAPPVMVKEISGILAGVVSMSHSINNAKNFEIFEIFEISNLNFIFYFRSLFFERSWSEWSFCIEKTPPEFRIHHSTQESSKSNRDGSFFSENQNRRSCPSLFSRESSNSSPSSATSHTKMFPVSNLWVYESATFITFSVCKAALLSSSTGRRHFASPSFYPLRRFL